MKTERSYSPLALVLLTGLRFAIGWHLFYEGLVKLMDPAWTSLSFLTNARGPLSGILHHLASSDTLLRATDLANEFGLLLIGTGLILGLFSRAAAWSGIVLLFLYYFAYPPFGSSLSLAPAEGSYLLINKNLIEILALAVLLLFPTERLTGLDRLLFRKKKETTSAPKHETAETGNQQGVTGRREILKSLATAPFFGALLWGAFRSKQWESVDAVTGATISLNVKGLKDLNETLPKGKIKGIEFSRMILGANLISGYAHARDLRYANSLFKAYNTNRKVFETLQLCEASGIDTICVTNGNNEVLKLYRRYYGSDIKTIFQIFPAQYGQTEFKPDEYKKDIDLAAENGATAMYVQGGVADSLLRQNRLDIILRSVEYIRSLGFSAGVGGHSILVPMAVEKEGGGADFYVKTAHHDRYWSAHPREFREEFSVDRERFLDHNKFHDNMFDLFPEKTVDFFRTVEKPWIAFKVLAAGAIPPDEGFRYAFENGADFICVGMFDFQVVENVNTAGVILRSELNRIRPWYS
ncbi:MAG: hypothetical protein ACOYXB_07055 [Bacteroidota bacterium]